MHSIDQDKALIESLGGPAKLAEMLGYEKEGGVQRVQNWTTRGIPAAVKLQHPELFLRDLKKLVKKQTQPTGAPNVAHRPVANGKPTKSKRRRRDGPNKPAGDKPSHRKSR